MADERVQRRLAAILAADVVGYSRLMEQDETGTLARLKSLRSEVFDPRTKQFDGRIFKTTGTARWPSSAAPSTRSNARSRFSARWRGAMPNCRRNSGS